MEKKCSLQYKSVWIWNALLLFSILLFSRCTTSLDDISPEKANGTNFGAYSPTGLIIGIAGDKGALYAVSPNAGIWKNGQGSNGLFGSWKQLQTSPRYSNCIAVDPLNDQHIVVGERIGDAIKNTDNKCGAWESFDGGATFPDQYYFDPSVFQVLLPDALKNQLVGSVVFTSQRTILLATTYGIARKTLSSNSYTFLHTPTSVLVTALATFDEYIVARDQTNIYVSNDDGVNWTTTAIPATVDGLTVTWNARGDLYSIAGIKGSPIMGSTPFFVYLSFKPTEVVGNKNSILIFDVHANTWHAQTLATGDGTGLGGRRFIKSFDLTASSNAKQVGYSQQLIYSGAQDIMQATNIDNNGIPTWRPFVQSRGSGNPVDNVHNDLWDFHFDPTGTYAFVACDGGIYDDIPFAEFPSWTSLNSGLHTHHIHSLVTEFSDNLNVIGYATSDNDAWANQQSDNWFVIGCCGDANWVANDQGSGTKLLSIRHFKNGAITSFPSLTTTPLTINNDLTFDAQQIKCIQTRTDEPAQTSLDVVMLANLPLQYEQAKVLNTVPGVLGQPNANGNPVLLRNKAFELNADINISKGAGWEMLSDNVPVGTTAFWVTGGHRLPTCYVYAEVSGTPGIYKREPIETKFPHGNSWTWVRLNIDNVDPPAEYGPLFVNPYDTKILYVATANGIYVSPDGGNSFTEDNVLTNLVTASGKYAMSGTFSGGNGTSIPGSAATHANPMCPLSCMEFERNHPDRMVAASPFTGVFYKDNSTPWKDLSKYLPKPFTPISSVGISKSDIYIATEGRGLLRINNY